MAENHSISSYRNILKGTSIFGGTQIFYALIGVIRAKFIAILLGTTGMGINALLYSATLPILQTANFGLNLSLVREISDTDDVEKRKKIISLGKRTFIYSSLLGMLLCIILSPILSYYSFGDFSYTLSFIALGTMVFFSIMSSAYVSILQGLRELKRLAWSTVWGSALGLAICIPLYYFFRDKGIVPGLIAVVFSNWLVIKIKSRKHIVSDFKTPLSGQIQFIKKLLKIGIVLTLTGIFTSGTTYLINIFIRYYSDISFVGFYQAANSITNQYATIVFAALAADYFPRLVAATKAKNIMTTTINRQMEIVLLIIMPVACVVIAGAPFFIRLLLSDSFEAIIPLVRLFGISVIIKGLTYPLGYVTLANNDKKVYFIIDGIVGNMITLALICSGFYYYGLVGVGIAMIINELIISVVYLAVNHHLYSFILNKEILLTMVGSIALAGCTFAFTAMEHKAASYIFSALICIVAASISVIKLKKLIAKREPVESY